MTLHQNPTKTAVITSARRIPNTTIHTSRQKPIPVALTRDATSARRASYATASSTTGGFSMGAVYACRGNASSAMIAVPEDPRRRGGHPERDGDLGLGVLNP